MTPPHVLVDNLAAVMLAGALPLLNAGMPLNEPGETHALTVRAALAGGPWSAGTRPPAPGVRLNAYSSGQVAPWADHDLSAPPKRRPP